MNSQAQVHEKGSSKLGLRATFVRRGIAIFATVAATATTALLMSPGAHAASATTSCTSAVTQNYSLSPGETFTLTMDGSCEYLGPGMGDTGSTTWSDSQGNEFALTPNQWTNIAPGLPVVIAIYSGPALACGQTKTDVLFTTASSFQRQSSYYLTSNGAPCAGGHRDVLQQVGRAADGSCVGVGTQEMNIGGAASGGWGESWAQWINDRKGGDVCTRTLTWNSSTQAYTVAP